MPFALDAIVPWGRSLDEYRSMFGLSDAELSGRIVDCGGGPASAAAEQAARGATWVAADPLYEHERAAIADRIDATFDTVIDGVRANMADFVWEWHGSVEEHAASRRASMDAFLDDYERGRDAGRYVVADVRSLPFEADAFDLALSSHLLFLYSGMLTLEDHVAALEEMCRVAPEARIFPLLELGNRPSRHLDGVVAAMRSAGRVVSIERVDYEFQRGGDRMLRVRRDSATDGR